MATWHTLGLILYGASCVLGALDNRLSIRDCRSPGDNVHLYLNQVRRPINSHLNSFFIGIPVLQDISQLSLERITHLRKVTVAQGVAFRKGGCEAQAMAGRPEEEVIIV